MSDVFPADYHASTNQPGLEKGIDDEEGSKHAGACIGNIEDKGVRKTEVLFQPHGCTRFKRNMEIWTITAGNIRTNEQVYILRAIFRILEAVCNGLLR